MNSSIKALAGGGGKRTRDDGETVQLPQPLFFPSNHHAFPTAIDEATFPSMKYHSRRGELKTAIHWGQRKLLLSEMQLLIAAFREKRAATSGFHIVYAGAAPGSHLALLDDWFPDCRWTLVDPMPCDDKLRRRKNFRLEEDYFTDATALRIIGQRFIEANLPSLGKLYHQHYAECVQAEQNSVLQADKDRLQFKELGVQAVEVASAATATAPRGLALLANAALDDRAPALFICDIRSGYLSMQENAEKELFESAEDFERHVQADMRAQMQWVDVMLPTMSLLKFRLPYMEVFHPVTKKIAYQHMEPTTEYLAGTVLLPIWTRPTSTEGRLLVRCPMSRYPYNNRRYEDQCFFFNSVLRERVHFDHCIEENRSMFLDHRYDGAAEVHVLLEYLALRLPAQASLGEATPKGALVLALSSAITAALGKTFLEASQRLPRVVMEKARLRGFEASQRALEAASDAFRQLDVWWRRLPADSGDGKSAHSSSSPCGPAASMWNFLRADQMLASVIVVADS